MKAGGWGPAGKGPSRGNTCPPRVPAAEGAVPGAPPSSGPAGRGARGLGPRPGCLLGGLHLESICRRRPQAESGALASQPRALGLRGRAGPRGARSPREATPRPHDLAFSPGPQRGSCNETSIHRDVGRALHLPRVSRNNLRQGRKTRSYR